MQTQTKQPTTPREIRLRAGWPQHKLALIARVGVSTVRLYEANPEAVANPALRARLADVYGNLAQLV